MTGQGETVQLFNHVGATGFRGPEGWASPPSHSIYMKSRSSARCSRLKPWAEGERGAMDLGRCSHPCLLQGYIHGEFSVPRCLCLFCFRQVAPLHAEWMLFLSHTASQAFLFGWRMATHQATCRAHHRSRMCESSVVA